MLSSLRWVYERPSKSLLLALLLLVILVQTDSCSATESANKTLTEVKAYNFTDGFYNVVKFSEQNDGVFRIMHETEIIYLNLSYTAPTDGYLDIYLKPLFGPYPYIKLEDNWEIKSMTYSISLTQGESTYFLLSPPLIFSDYNSSLVVGGGLTLWELYTWPSLGGLINYTFTSSDDTNFDIVCYPTFPRESEKINLFADSNVEMLNLSWRITGNSVDWVNETDVLVINNLEAGSYSVILEGYDIFNDSHIAKAVIIVKSPVIEPTNFDVKFFSLTYPETIDLGNNIAISATIDYTIPGTMNVKCVLTDPNTGKEINENIYELQSGGSTSFNYQFEATQSGVNPYLLQLFYNNGENWVELTGSQRAITISVNEPIESQMMSGFSLLTIIAGIISTIVFVRWKIISD
ncbi:hypothetical protein E2P71_09130 [Candidatus Bathyarchaeota archaeon]|nr:hypothetical protein E2P71_09130 [Candidatus Bathyarchaeota archaeon]